MCEPIQIYHSAWNINNRYVLKEYDDENILKRNIAIINILGKEQIPVPRVVKPHTGLDFISYNKKHYVLTTKLEGKNIVNIDECGDKWFFEFGETLAKLHLAFLKCEEEINCWHNSLLGEMNSWVKENLLKYQPEFLEIEDYENTINELGKVYDILPKQLIHRDVHLGNFLFSDGKFSGYIDFDLSQINIRIFDICYFLLGFLLEDDENHIKEDKWYGIARQVVKGYDEKMNLSTIEKNAITCVMKNIELLFVAYFLGIGDEKSAEDSAKLFYFVKNNEEKIKNWLR